MSIGVLAALWLIVDLCILLGYITLMRHSFAQRHRRRVARVSALVLMLIAACGVPYSVNALLAGWKRGGYCDSALACCNS